MKLQPLSAKRGEVSFRHQLTHQHLGKRQEFSHEYTQKEMRKVFKEKIKRNREDFSELAERGIPFSPFLEIGSGYGQAAILLVNEFGAQGYATDLAIEPLKAFSQTARTLRFTRLPKTIACDAESLPFPNNSFPFVFCYQTLHHFPHPGKVIQEAYRVLAPGGYFFFAEEPVAQTFNIPLWRRPTKLRLWEKFLKATLILPFISRIGKTEVEHGILEETFSLSVWKQSLSPFQRVEAELFPFPFGPTGILQMENGKWKMENFKDRLSRAIIFFLGGGINGLAHKMGSIPKKPSIPPVTCANCSAHAKLTKRSGKLICPSCKYRFAQRDGITILLPRKLEERLYPPKRIKSKFRGSYTDI